MWFCLPSLPSPHPLPFSLPKTPLNLLCRRTGERQEECLHLQSLHGKHGHLQQTHQRVKTPRGSWSFIVTDKPGNLFLCSTKLTAQGGKRTDPSCCPTCIQHSFLIASWYPSLPVSCVMKWCDFNQFWLHLALKVYSVQSLEAHYRSAPFQGRSLFFIRVRKTGLLLSRHSEPAKDLRPRWPTDFVLSNYSYIVNRAVCNSIL